MVKTLTGFVRNGAQRAAAEQAVAGWTGGAWSRARHSGQHRLGRAIGHLAGYGALLGYIWYRGRASKRSAA